MLTRGSGGWQEGFVVLLSGFGAEQFGAIGHFDMYDVDITVTRIRAATDDGRDLAMGDEKR